MDALISTTPELAEYVKPNKYGVDSVDFAHPMAVKLLNQALLKHSYGIAYWDFPEGKLCPPIPMSRPVSPFPSGMVPSLCALNKSAMWCR